MCRAVPHRTLRLACRRRLRVCHMHRTEGGLRCARGYGRLIRLGHLCCRLRCCDRCCCRHGASGRLRDGLRSRHLACCRCCWRLNCWCRRSLRLQLCHRTGIRREPRMDAPLPDVPPQDTRAHHDAKRQHPIEPRRTTAPLCSGRTRRRPQPGRLRCLRVHGLQCIVDHAHSTCARKTMTSSRLPCTLFSLSNSLPSTGISDTPGTPRSSAEVR